jgi:DNA-binding MarR family transcriptional regulator
MDAHLRAECGRSLDDYDVLHQVRSHDGAIRMGDLARRLLMANSSCNRIVGRLVDDGLLSRRRGTDDHREVLLELTPAGRRQWRRMAAVHTRDIERSIGNRLTGRQQVQLDALLRRLLDA